MVAANSKDLMCFEQFAAPIDTTFAINDIPGADYEVELTWGEELDGGFQEPIFSMDVTNSADAVK
jgi:hypothetical protein